MALFCLTVFTAASGLPVIAENCSSNMNKKAEIKCSEDDIKCQTKKAKKFELNKALRS